MEGHTEEEQGNETENGINSSENNMENKVKTNSLDVDESHNENAKEEENKTVQVCSKEDTLDTCCPEENENETNCQKCEKTCTGDFCLLSHMDGTSPENNMEHVKVLENEGLTAQVVTDDPPVKQISSNTSSVTPKNEINEVSEINKSTSRELVKCQLCSETFSGKSCLASHVQTHSGVSVMEYSCRTCGQMFGRLVELDKHMHSHSGQGSESQCSVCEETFDEIGNLIVHEQLHDIGDKRMVDALNDSEDLKITKCDYSSTDPDIDGENTSRGHESSTHGTKFKEKHCHESHTGEKTFIKDMRTCLDKKQICKISIDDETEKTAQDAGFDCTVCDRTSAENKEHKQHKINYAQEFECDQCQQPFTAAAPFEKHMSIHTDLKYQQQRYTCTDCN